MMPEPLIYTGLHHVSVLVTDLERARNFYLEVLGLEEDTSRPDMSFPGLWLKAGHQQIHLLALDSAATGTAAESPGRDAHFALAVSDVSHIENRLRERSIPYNMSQSGRRALFCRDPDGNGIEFIELVE